MKKIVSLVLALMVAASSVFALEMRVWTREDAPTFDKNAKALPLRDNSDDSEDAPKVRFLFKGKNLHVKVESVGFDADVEPDYIGVWDVPFDGAVKSNTLYEMEFSGGMERFPSVRVTVTDSSGASLQWVDLDDNMYGANFFVYSTEDRTKEIAELAKKYYARHNGNKMPKNAEVKIEDDWADIHLFDKSFSKQTTLAKYRVYVPTCYGDTEDDYEVYCLYE